MLLFLNFRFIMFDGTAQMFLMLFIDSNIIVIQVNQRSFLVRSKEMIFSIIVNSFERLH